MSHYDPLVGLTPEAQGYLHEAITSAVLDVLKVDVLGGVTLIPAGNQDLQLSFEGGITRILGDLVVNGETVTLSSETLLVADNHIYLNDGYTTPVAETVGIFGNYLPTSASDTVAGTYTAGVASVSNPTVVTAGSNTFSVGQFIQFSESTDNAGVFEVLSHIGTLLTVRGIGNTSTVEAFTRNQFTAGASDGATITNITVTVIQAGTDGLWEQAASSTTGLSFTDFVQSSVTLIAGAGLTGGGDLSQDRTFDVVANADGSIVVNADDILVGVLATDAQHGIRGGGTQHSAVVAAGSSGFMTGADKTKLDGIEALADVTDTANVTAAGALMRTGGTMTGAINMGAQSITNASLIQSATNLLLDSVAGKTALQVAGIDRIFADSTGVTVNVNSGGIISLKQASTNRLNIDQSGGISITPNTGQELLLGVASGITRIPGDLVVDGTRFISETTTVRIADTHMSLNSGYTIASALTTGWFGNILPGTSDSVAGSYIAGVDLTSNPTVVTSGSGTYTTGQFVQFSDSTDNDGLYEVLSHVGTLLTIRGVGLTGAVEDISQNQFTAGLSDGATIVAMSVGSARFGTDGLFETAFGSSSGLTYSDAGDFFGPGSSVTGNLVSFGDTTGRLGADSGVTATSVSAHLTSTSNPHATSIANIGTGTLAQLNTAVSDATLIADTRTLTAGAGLTGGGDLTADRTFDVVANADGSITVNTNDVQVGILATDAQHGVRGGGTQHADVVSGGADGFMTGADKAILDGLVSGGPFLPLAGGAMSGAITTLAGSGAGAGVTLNLTAGIGGTTGIGGAITIAAGAGGATSGSGGNLVLNAGDASGGVSFGGSISLTSGAGAGTGNGGPLDLTAGGDSVSTSGGAVNITGGEGGASGGAVNINGGAAGASGGSGSGGTINLIAGLGSNIANGGNVVAVAGGSGTGATGNGGGLFWIGGDANSTNGNGGNITLSPGSGTGSGSNGLVVFNANVDMFGEIRGSVGSATTPTYSFTADLDTGMYLFGDGELALTAAGVPVWVFFSGAAQTDFPYRGTNGTAAAPMWSFQLEAAMGMYRVSSGILGFSTVGSERLTIGNVGNTIINGSAITTQTALTVGSLDAITTGIGISVISNAANLGDSKLLSLVNDNVSSAGECLFIQNDGVGNALEIDSNGNGTAIDIDTEATTGVGINIAADVLTDGSGLIVSSNASSPSTRNLVEIINDNTLASGTTCLFVRQDKDGSPAATFMGNVGIGDVASATNQLVINRIITTETSAGLQFTGYGDHNYINFGGSGRCIGVRSDQSFFMGYNFLWDTVSNTYDREIADEAAGIEFTPAGDIELKTAPTGIVGSSFTATTMLKIENTGAVFMSSLKSGTLAAPPAGIASGELWEDTTDSAAHPIVRIAA